MQEDKKAAGPDDQKLLLPAASASALPRLVSVFAAGVIVGVLVAWGYSTSKRAETVADANRPASQAAGLAIGADGEVISAFVVESPQPAGKRVAIAKAVVAQPTWVVVYEQSATGGVGRALGASLFNAKRSSGDVPLLRATTPGKTYLVGQSLDNGNGTFSTTADKPVLSGERRLLTTFTAQ